MPSLSPEEKLDYVIGVLKHTAEFSPNFHDVAKDHNLVNGNKA
jgi:hypothetical protein